MFIVQVVFEYPTSELGPRELGSQTDIVFSTDFPRLLSIRAFRNCYKFSKLKKWMGTVGTQ